MQGLQVTLGQALLPVMEAFGRVIREHIMPLVKQASQYVKEHSGEFEGLANTIKAFVQPVIEVIIGLFIGLTSVVKFLSENLNLAIPIIAGIGTVMLIAFAPAIWGVVVAVWAAVSAVIAFTIALLANPVTWIVLGIGALIAVIVLLAMNWDKVVAWISDVWNGFIGWISPGLRAFGDFFGSIFQGIGDFVRGIFEGIVNGIKGAINMVIDVINGAIDGVNWVADRIRDVTGGQVDIHVDHVPRLAQGGVVPATPGGRLVRVAEAGEDEAVIPLSKLGNIQGGSKQTVNYYAAPNQSIDSQQALFDGMRRAKLLAGW
jgi:phage-related protein